MTVVYSFPCLLTDWVKERNLGKGRGKLEKGDEKETRNLLSTYDGTRYYVIYFPSAIPSIQQSYEVDIIPIVQMSKLRLREVKWHVQGLIARL